MAGLGRRSHYRKHITDAVWNDLPEPQDTECIGKVVGTRGSNQFEVVLAPSVKDGGEMEPVISLDKTPQLAILPTKFRKLIWVKRNDYVICSCAKDSGGDEDEHAENDPSGDSVPTSSRSSSIEGGIRYMITHILYKDQVKHLKEINKWPLDPFFSEKASDGNEDKEEAELREKAKAIWKQEREKEVEAYDSEQDSEEEYGQYHEDGYEDDDNGIVYGNDECDDYLVNMNRIAKMKIEDSSSDEDSD